MPDATGHEPPDAAAMQDRADRIRAAVLGANDGIVSTAGLAGHCEARGLPPGPARSPRS